MKDCEQNEQPWNTHTHSSPPCCSRHFSCSITHANFLAALKALEEQQPETDCSLDPADYQLKSLHLNAEITFETAPAEMGWSMRRALLTLEEGPALRQ